MREIGIGRESVCARKRQTVNMVTVYVFILIIKSGIKMFSTPAQR